MGMIFSLTHPLTTRFCFGGLGPRYCLGVGGPPQFSTFLTKNCHLLLVVGLFVVGGIQTSSQCDYPLTNLGPTTRFDVSPPYPLSVVEGILTGPLYFCESVHSFLFPLRMSFTGRGLRPKGWCGGGDSVVHEFIHLLLLS